MNFTQIIGDKLYTFQMTLVVISVEDVHECKRHVNIADLEDEDDTVPITAIVIDPKDIVQATLVESEDEDLAKSEASEDSDESSVSSLDEDELEMQIIEEELKQDKSYHKMDTILRHIEQDDLETLKQYIGAVHPNIKISRTSSIQSLSDKLLDEALRAASVKQIKDSMERVRAIINAQTANVNYLSKRFQNIRKILRDRFGEKSAIYKLHYKKGGLTNEQYADKEMTGKANRDNRLANRIQVDEKSAHEILNKTSASDDVFDNIIALQIATGGRFIEAVRVSSLKKVPYSDRVVKVVGIAKRKDGASVEIDRPIFGMDIDELLELHKSVRRELKTMYPQIDTLDNEALDKLLLNNVNRRVKELDIPGVTSSHIMRKIFANITHAQLPKENRDAIDKHLHIKTVLGHKNLETAGNYANVRIKRAGAIRNQEDIEQKFAVVDRVNDRQDDDIKQLQAAPAAELLPENKAIVRGQPKIVQVLNIRGDMVDIQLRVPDVRGNSKNRILDIMKQLFDGQVIITEAVLRKSFHFGGAIIASVKNEKAEYNSRLLGK